MKKYPHYIPALSVGLLAFLLYAFTGARTIQWQDSAQFTYRIVSGTLWNEYGLAMVHPLHFWLGRLSLWIFPGPDPWAVSLVSAFGGALAVGLVYLCVHKITNQSKAALFAAITLLFAHTFWRFSGLPEVYTLSAALLLAEGLAYLHLYKTHRPQAWWMLFFFNGLGFANHNLALLSSAVWGLLFLRWCAESSGRWKHLIAIAGAWVMGALPYLALIVVEMNQTRSVGPVVHSALFGEGFHGQVTGLVPQLRYTFISVGFLLLSFPSLALVFVGIALTRLRSAKLKMCLPFVAIGLLHLLFFLRYNVIDQYTFLIPVFALLALMAGVGYAHQQYPIFRRIAWILIVIQPILYSTIPTLVRGSGVLKSFARQKPYRDDYGYLFYPWQVQERSADRLVREAFGTLGESGSLVIEDSMFLYTAGWMREELELNESVDLIRPGTFADKTHLLPVVWVPARADKEPSEGWRKEGEVWVVPQALLPEGT